MTSPTLRLCAHYHRNYTARASQRVQEIVSGFTFLVNDPAGDSNNSRIDLLVDSHDSLPIDNPTLSAVRQVSSDSITSMSFHAPTLLHLLLRKLLHQLKNCTSARPNSPARLCRNQLISVLPPPPSCTTSVFIRLTNDNGNRSEREGERRQ